MTTRQKISIPLTTAAVGMVFGAGAWIGRTAEVSGQYVTRVEYSADRAKDRERIVADSVDKAVMKRILVKMSCKLLNDCDP